MARGGRCVEEQNSALRPDGWLQEEALIRIDMRILRKLSEDS